MVAHILRTTPETPLASAMTKDSPGSRGRHGLPFLPPFGIPPFPFLAFGFSGLAQQVLIPFPFRNRLLGSCSIGLSSRGILRNRVRAGCWPWGASSLRERTPGCQRSDIGSWGQVAGELGSDPNDQPCIQNRAPKRKGLARPTILLYLFSGGKMVFHSRFMSTTVQPLAFASSSALSSLPTDDSRSYAHSRSPSV